jgi:hypothetical protein
MNLEIGQTTKEGFVSALLKGIIMLFENQNAIQLRKDAARHWINNFVASDFVCVSKEQKALAVIVLDSRISNWLAEHDPQALKQAQEALS